MSNRSRISGFTLIEIMIAVIIVGILAAIALPSYYKYIERSRRTDAQKALMDLANREEQYFLDRRTYTDKPEALGLAKNPRSQDGYYDLAIAPGPAAEGGIRAGYAISATPVKGGTQERDTLCATFTLTSKGVRGAESQSHADSKEECWRQ
jgi:type IV pilus assembly protein PilE